MVSLVIQILVDLSIEVMGKLAWHSPRVSVNRREIVYKRILVRSTAPFFGLLTETTRAERRERRRRRRF